jgi:hypothetical protein
VIARFNKAAVRGGDHAQPYGLAMAQAVAGDQLEGVPKCMSQIEPRALAHFKGISLHYPNLHAHGIGDHSRQRCGTRARQLLEKRWVSDQCGFGDFCKPASKLDPRQSPQDQWIGQD